MSGNCYQDIKNTILTAPAGTAFAKVDFEGYGNDATVRQALSRLVREGFCKKVLPSVYYRPVRVEDREDCIGPNAVDVAFARARNCGWKIVLAPELAMYEFGLTNLAPERLEVWTTGQSHLCAAADCCDISFRHAVCHWLQKMSPDCLLTVSALMGLKEIGISILDLEHIAEQLQPSQQELLLAERGSAPAWMRPYLELIGCDMAQDAVEHFVGVYGE